MARQTTLRRLLLTATLALAAPVVGFAVESIAAAFIIGALAVAVLTAILFERESSGTVDQPPEPDTELVGPAEYAAPRGGTSRAGAGARHG
jgi:hypothetical protein